MKRRQSIILTKYMFKGFLLPFACALLGFAALFLLNNFFDDISDFMSAKVPIGTTIRFFLLKQPANLTNVIPISVLLAASFMTLMMGRHNELTALRAAGLSLGACMTPVWCMAVLASLTVFAINESWGPACAKQAEQIDHQLIHTKRKEGPVSFHHPVEKRDWSFSKLSPNGVGENLILRQAPNNGNNGWLITAKTTQFRNGEWLLQDGFLQEDDGNGGKKHTAFQERTLLLSEKPADILAHAKNWELATIRELLVLLKSDILSDSASRATLRTLIWHRLFFPLAAVIAALFGVSLTIATDRTGLMKGFASAVFLLVFYYLVAQFFLVLGKNGYRPPVLAGAFPAVAFLVAAITVAWRKQ